MKMLPSLFGIMFMSASLAAANLTGLWSVDLIPDFGGVDDSFGCSLDQAGEKLTLNCGSGPNIAGEVHGRQVTWQVKTGRTNQYTALFAGELDERETTISGTWHLEDNLGKREGKFLAKKVSK